MLLFTFKDGKNKVEEKGHAQQGGAHRHGDQEPKQSHGRENAGDGGLGRSGTKAACLDGIVTVPQTFS